jgi:hypothetical protein
MLARGSSWPAALVTILGRVRGLPKFRISHVSGFELNHYPFLLNVPDLGV